MKNLHKIFFLLASCFILNNASAQKQNDEAMKAMMAYATPGEAQKMMSKSAGDWKADVMMTMDPSAPPIRSQAVVHDEMLMGGRYLTTHYAGQMMGMPFEGLGTIGFDNGKKMYYSTWVDNMGTGIMYMEGNRGDDGKSIEFKGKGFDPAVGKDVMMREVMTFMDDNHHKVEMFQMMGDKEQKVMEINLTK